MAEIELRAESAGVLVDFLIQEAGAAVDISAATRKDLIFRRPDGSQYVLAASFKTTGTDGCLRWTTTAAELDKKWIGRWTVEADLAGVSGFTGPTRAATFYLLPRVRS
jgi:hypothetical protein